MKKITVILADDHVIIREGIRALLEQDGGFEVIGEAADGRQAESLILSLCPDVVVLDIAMPQLNGIEVARRILQQMKLPPKIIMLSAHGDDAYIDQVVALGVAGYLVKQTSAQILAQAIRAVYAGKCFYSPSIAQRLGGRPRLSPGPVNRNKKAVIELPPGNARYSSESRRAAPCGRIEYQHQNGRKTPPERDDQTRPSRYRRPDPLCHCGGRY